MLKTLLKKQMQEVFKSYFYDQKKNKGRSKSQTITYLVLLAALMILVFGGTFAAVAIPMCTLCDVGLDWLYYAMMGGIAVLIGVFVGAFNTYSGVYLAKDNDLLLSMPIPTKTIVAARLVNVYLLGLMYSSLIFLPTVVVRQIVCGFSLQALCGGIAMLIVISVVDLVLSCLLGWIIAKISVHLKNKSFVTVLISVVFFAVYYVFQFKLQSFIEELLTNALVYGQTISDAAPFLVMWGNCGAGDLTAVLLNLGLSVLAVVLTCLVMSRSFIKLATATGKQSNPVYREKKVKAKSADGALLAKEFKRFTSSAAYMLNGGFGILFLPVFAVAVLLFGSDVLSVIPADLALPLPVFVCAALCMLGSMNDMTAPSVSLEGKNIWILQSLPVTPWQILKAKLSMHLWLSCIPMLFASVCVLFVLPCSFIEGLMCILLPQAYVLLSALVGLMAGLKGANLTWTNEIIPIKQSGSVAIAIFGGWGYAAVVGGVGYILSTVIGSGLTLTVLFVLTCLAAYPAIRWTKTKGARIFAEL